MAIFEKQVRVRFKHVDAAGIMFYPRYFELINDVVEDWFSEGIGESFNQLHIKERRAVPTAHVDVDFHAPSKLEDGLTFVLSVTRIGTSSCTLSILVSCEGQARLSANLVLVHMDMNTGKSLPWPDGTRAALKRWQMGRQSDNGEDA